MYSFICFDVPYIPKNININRRKKPSKYLTNELLHLCLYIHNKSHFAENGHDYDNFCKTAHSKNSPEPKIQILIALQ